MEIVLELTGMARSTFYYHMKDREDKYVSIRKRIAELFTHHRGCYGSRRITLCLQCEGEKIHHKTVERLMREMGLQAKQTRRTYRSYRGEIGAIAPNVVNRDFNADRPYEKLATDVTQVSIGDRKVYLSPLMDMYNGEIISYTISEHPDLSMVMQMLHQAIVRLPKRKCIILHSDQGWHYQHWRYQQFLHAHGIIQSMSRKGNCLDNAMMENFFGRLKTEMVYGNKFADVGDFKRQCEPYIDYYNNERIKLRLKMSPVEYRLLYSKQYDENNKI